MSRRNLPPIDPTDLRDHADGERIDRIWTRLEHGLPSPERARKRPRATTVMLLAAALGAFAGGLVVGRSLDDHEPIGPAPLATAPHDEPESNVFAAGSQARTFSLPGGGQLRLGPGATVEIDRTEGEMLTLQMVQGHAEVSAEQRVAGLAVVAGEARLTSPVGSVVTIDRQAGSDTMKVHVQSGVVELVAPAGVDERLEVGDERSVAVRRAITAVVPSVLPRRERPTPAQTAEPNAPPAPAAVAATPSWQALVSKYDYPAAFKLLKDYPGGVDAAIAAAKSASELMMIGDVTHGRDTNAAIKAYQRVVAEHPGDANAGFAARRLADIYDKRGQKGDEVAAQLADMYRERTKQLRPELASSQTCTQLRNAQKAGKVDEAKRHATEYLRIDPNGDCRDDANRVLAGETLESEEPAAAPEPTAHAPNAPPATSASAARPNPGPSPSASASNAPPKPSPR